MPARQKSLLEAFNYNVKKVKNKKANKQSKPETIKQEATSKNRVEEKNVVNNTEKTGGTVSLDELTRAGTSVDVDDVYRDIRDGPSVRVITKIMFSEEVEYKEPNIAELRKISLVEE